MILWPHRSTRITTKRLLTDENGIAANQKGQTVLSQIRLFGTWNRIAYHSHWCHWSFPTLSTVRMLKVGEPTQNLRSKFRGKWRLVAMGLNTVAFCFLMLFGLSKECGEPGWNQYKPSTFHNSSRKSLRLPWDFFGISFKVMSGDNHVTTCPPKPTYMTLVTHEVPMTQDEIRNVSEGAPPRALCLKQPRCQNLGAS